MAEQQLQHYNVAIRERFVHNGWLPDFKSRVRPWWFPNGLSFVWRSSVLGAAPLQDEIAPKNFNFKTKNGPKNVPKLPRKFLSLVLLCRISHRHYSKIFHREFPHKMKYFFTTRICRHGHANKCLRAAPLQDEIAPKELNLQIETSYENPKNATKGSRII